MWSFTLASVGGHTVWGDVYTLLLRGLERFLETGWEIVRRMLMEGAPGLTGLALVLIGLAMIATGQTQRWGAWALVTFFAGTVVRILLK